MASGLLARLSGGDTRWNGYGIITLLVILSGCIGTFSLGHDVTWRIGTPHNLWEPALWETSSGIVVLALLPLARTGALLLRAPRLPAAVFAVGTLALTYAALHITGMGFVREAAYRVAGWPFTFPWSNEFVYELRKDLFSYAIFLVIFWRVEGRAKSAVASYRPDVITSTHAEKPAVPPHFWIRDGRNSTLIDPNQILTVASAGNYVEYVLSGGQSHLIRATLQSQENQLASFGIARVHRGRLVNLVRIVAIEWRASGDFELRLDTGDTVAGSRRFKAAVADLVGPSRADHV